MRQLLVVSTRGLGHLLQMLEAIKYKNTAMLHPDVDLDDRKPPL